MTSLRLHAIILSLALLPALAHAAPKGRNSRARKAPKPAAAETAAQQPAVQPSTATVKGLNCKDKQAVRDFKDEAMAKLLGNSEAGQKEAAEWARCICGRDGDLAGASTKLPKNPLVVPTIKNCPLETPRTQCAEEAAAEYFAPNLSVSKEQAAKLGRCALDVTDKEAADAAAAAKKKAAKEKKK